MSNKASKRSRAAAYRLIRHAVVDSKSIRPLVSPIEWHLVKSLSRDNKHAAEKEQVVKLIRAIINHGVEARDPHSAPGMGRVALSDAIMRALIAVADDIEDTLHLVCIETIIEIRKYIG